MPEMLREVRSSVLFPMRGLSPVQLRSPIEVSSRGQRFPIQQIMVPDKMAPFIHQTAVASELVSEPLAVGKTLAQFGKLRVVGAQLGSGSIVLDFSGREETTFKRLLTAFQDAGEQALLTDAYQFISEKMAGNVRKDGEPYPTHPTEVASIIVEEFGVKKLNVVLAAFCHDLLEDIPDMTFDSLKARFGEEVATIVRLCSREEAAIPGVKKPSEDYMRDIVANPDAAILKCADTLSNAGTLYRLVNDKTRRKLTNKYFPEVRDFLLPWARENGQTTIVKAFEAWLSDPLTLADLEAFKSEKGKKQ